jgi:putative oxidoreductase
MRIVERIEALLSKLSEAQWLPQLLMRLFIGYFFLETGWGKVHNLGAMAERFEDWGIPAPAFNAALSGYTELIGGTLVLAGLLTRLASIPLVINMLVALLVVKMKKVSGIGDFVELDEPLYALSFLWLVFSGPGKASLDHLLSRVLRRSLAGGPTQPALRAG